MSIPMQTIRNRHDNHGAQPSGGIPSGLLPFVGREDELERVADFFRSTIATDKLAMLWLQGEAGIGKSRFLEHIRTELATEENFVLYVRLYPDSATSIVQALGGAIEGHARLHAFFPGTASRTLLSIQAALRRIARLRPTLLIIDDINLLSEDSIYEVMDLFSGLREEPIAVVCSSRPGVIPAYDALYIYKTATLELNSLRLEDVRQLLVRCYGAPAVNDAVLRKVYDVTHGIPLVLRAAMTDYLGGRAEGLLSNLSAFPRTSFHMKARLSINALVTCLTSRLTPQEEEGARKLALLGEVFAMDTGLQLFEGADGIIPALIEKEILSTPLMSPQPLIDQGNRSAALGFTHSLLYEHLAGAADPPWEDLLAVVESEATLFSLTPLLHLSRAPEKYGARTLHALVGVIESLADSLNRSLATPLYNAAVAMFQRCEEGLNRKVHLDIRLHLLRLRLHVIAYIPAHPDFDSTLDELLENTQDPATETIAIHRLAALEYSTYRRATWWDLALKDALNEAEGLGERFPALKTHKRFLKLLGTIAAAMRVRPAPTILERISQNIDRLLDSPDQAIRRAALEWIAAPLLTVFNSPEEMEQRRKLAEKIEKEYREEPRRGRLLTIWPQFLESTGDVLRARQILEERMVRPLRGYNLPEELGLRFLAMTCDAALGKNPSAVEQEARNILEEYKGLDREHENNQGFLLVRSSIVGHLVLIGALRGAFDWGRKVSDALCDGCEEEAKRYLRFEQAAVLGDTNELHELFEGNAFPEQYRSLVASLLLSSSTTAADQALDSARRLLEEPVFRRGDLLRLYTVIGLTRSAIAAERLPRRSLRIEIRNALKGALSWCVEHELPGYMRPLLETAKDFLNQDDYRNWNERLIGIEKKIEQTMEWDTGGDAQNDARRKLSMIGAIQVQEENGEWKRISGARVRHVLGLLTANAMNRNVMELDEFRKLATGMESSQEAANYLRIMISRLRRLLGEESIISEGDTAPQLNPEFIRVDLVAAADLVETTLNATRSRNFHAAFKSVTQALRIVGEQVILPALFDDFFDNARHEFEIRLRRATIATLDLMKLPDDSDYALLLLRLAERAIPQDEELAERLSKTLRYMGRHVEALNIEHRVQDSFD